MDSAFYYSMIKYAHEIYIRLENPALLILFSTSACENVVQTLARSKIFGMLLGVYLFKYRIRGSLGILICPSGVRVIYQVQSFFQLLLKFRAIRMTFKSRRNKNVGQQKLLINV